MAIVEAQLDGRKPALVSKLEYNELQLERLSPMAQPLSDTGSASRSKSRGRAS